MSASSYWVAFAKTLPMMLLFGIVGPIFLVVYFLIDEPDVEWMLWWGLAVTVLDVVLAAVIAWSRARFSVQPVTTQFSSRVFRSVRVEQAFFTPTTADFTTSTTPDDVPDASPAERLAELDELMRKDLLTTEEYEAARKRILGEL